MDNHQLFSTTTMSSYEDSKTSDSVNVSEMKDNDNERYNYIAVSLFVLIYPFPVHHNLYPMKKWNL
uniref:Uncharacterized protein n=1 Tax=Magallana gigas TaxID=29159 RepID=K1Q1V9_MAGGI